MCVINYFLGIVEPVNMKDAEFESLRLAFGRPAKKKWKGSGPRSVADDPADPNGYLGPWAPRISDENSVSSGPSEVSV